MNLVDGPRVWRRDIAMAMGLDENERHFHAANHKMKNKLEECTIKY